MENYEHNFSRVRLNQNTLSIMMVMVHVEAVFTIELGPRIQVSYEYGTLPSTRDNPVPTVTHEVVILEPNHPESSIRRE